MEDTALFFHLLGRFSFVAGTIFAGTAFEAACHREEPRGIALLLGPTRLGVLLAGVGTLLGLGFGLWLFHPGDWGYTAGWADTALGLLVATAALGTIGGRKPRQARKRAVRLAAEQAPATSEVPRAARRPRRGAANHLSPLTGLMMVEPGAPQS